MFLACVLLSALAASPSETGAKAALALYLADVDQGKFKTSGCARVNPVAWGAFLLLGEPIHHKVAFKKDCDIEGDLWIRRMPFKIDLKVRNLEDAKRITAEVSSDLNTDLFTQKVDLKIQVRSGKVFAKAAEAAMDFEADYRMLSGLDGKKNEGSGGEVRITRYRGGEVSGVSQPLKIR